MVNELLESLSRIIKNCAVQKILSIGTFIIQHIDILVLLPLLQGEKNYIEDIRSNLIDRTENQ